MSIAENLTSVQNRIAAAAKRAGRDPSAVKLVVVTKTVGTERIREALAAGAKVLGENRVQEAKDKIAQIGNVQDILIEVSIAGEAAKAGVRIGDAAGLVRETAKLKNVRVLGLMTMPPYSGDPENSRPYFRKLRELADAIIKENIPGVSMKALSIGMSGDFEVAVEEGATLVRVGTAIFGERR